MVIEVRDAHSHFFSHVFFETLAKAGCGGGDPQTLIETVAKRAGIELPASDPAEHQMRWITEMDRAGVHTMVTFASVPEEAEIVADACRNAGGRLVGYVVMNPLLPTALAFAERVLTELGLRGVVLFPALHHYDISDPALAPFFAVLAKHRAIAVVHCGILEVKLRDLFGLPRAYDARFANPLSLVRPASTNPDVHFVIPHFGGGLFREALLAGQWCENVYLDTSSSNGWIRSQVPSITLRDVFEHALAVFGPRRILFGTDSSTFPRGYRSDILAAHESILTGLSIGDEDRAAIMGGNLARVLG